MPSVSLGYYVMHYWEKLISLINKKWEFKQVSVKEHPKQKQYYNYKCDLHFTFLNILVIYEM